MSDRRSGQWVTSVAGRITAVVLLLGLGVVAPPPASAAPPANDNFASPHSLASAVSGTVTGVNLEATKEPAEPAHAGNAGGHSLWYSWTAPADGNESFSTFDSDFDTLLAVYTGAALSSLTTVASNDDVGGFGQSAVSFRVTKGVKYLIAVDGFSGKVGHLDLAWGPAPANDNFADAQVLPSATSGRVTGTTDGATPEVGEPLTFVGTIWYSWTAPRDGTYKFDTVGSTIFDTILGVYRGSTLDTLTRVGISDGDRDRPCCSSWVPIRNATAGTTYSIFVGAFEEGGFEAGGRVRLNWGPLVLGTSGPDILVGTAGDEEIRGLGGNDVLRGLGGNDILLGGAGNDEARGGAGNDVNIDLRGTDRLFGGSGDDRLNARDRRPGDLLAGGAGNDRCVRDRGDRRRGCP
jgi:Ca2+-binding RTX toxin-like protein